MIFSFFSDTLPRLLPRSFALEGVLLFSILLADSQAQITLDGTLGPKGPLAGPDYTINAEAGQLRGPNLFHSFGQFNVHIGESATFTGPSTVKNVIGRVTGGQQSVIDGALRSEMPKADLYLLNPSGVLFGPNASLDVPGSFHVSTADYLKLGDGGRFDATQPSNSVLTSAPPSAFGFLGSNPAPISIQGSSLQVPEGQTLSVIGGDITVVGRGTLPKEEEANLRAPDGKVQIASVASPGEVAPSTAEQAPGLAMSGFAHLGGIEVSQGGLISASGESGGSVVIRGGRLAVTGGAVIRTNTFGGGSGGTVDIAATESITIKGHLAGRDNEESRVASNTSASGDAGTVSISVPTLVIDGGSILASALDTSTGKGGKVEVKVERLMVSGGAKISSNARGKGPGGAVVITATESITIKGQASEVGSNTFDSGNAGTVSISAPTATLVIEEGGAISTNAGKGSTGKGGDIMIDVRRLALSNGTISAGVAEGAVGDGGKVEVKVGRLTMSDGGRIRGSTARDTTGRAGTVIVTATDSIIITGRDSNNDPSGVVSKTAGSGDAGTVTVSAPTLLIENGGEISADARENSTGKGGDVAVKVGRLTLSDGGRIRSETRGAGHGGAVDITATDSITIAGWYRDKDGIDRSGILVGTRGPGQGGNITVHARHITLDDGRISAFSGGNQKAGTITIHAAETFRSRNGRVTTSAAQAGGGQSALAAEAGGGQIALSAGSRVELVNSEVTATVVGGASNAGDITIDSRSVALNDSRVVAKAEQGKGRGGNIHIGADVFLASPASLVNASSDLGIDGTVDIRGPVSNLSGSIAPLPQSYLRTEMLVEDRCARQLQEGQVSSFVVAGRDGTPLQPGGVLPSPLADAAPASAGPSLEEHMAEGQKAFQAGAFEAAVLHWREAAGLYERAAKPAQQSEALRQLSQAYQSLGQYQEVLSNLALALALAKQAGDQTQTASVLHSLGNAHIATGPAENADPYFNEGLGIARRVQNPGLSAAILNDLGNLFTTQKRYAEALAAYQESLALAQTASSHQALAVRAQINAATAALQNGQYQEARALLGRAVDQIHSLEPSHDTAYGLVTIGLTYRTLRSHLPDSNGGFSRHAFNVLNEATKIAETINDQRAASYAWGYLGALYEDERRYQDALPLTRRATFAAQQVNAPESLYRWQWQTGRLLTALGQKEEAIAAYRGAVASLQAIRHGMSVSYGSTQTSFHESVGPVYFELVDLLLQRAAALPQREQSTPYLSEARETVELLRAAELRDYFRDDCVNAAQSRVMRLDVVSQTAVVIYPIILPDRMELLISLPRGLQRIAAPVSAETLTQEVRRLRHTLEKRTTREYLPHAQRLYDWLIRPLEPELVAASVDTLVFVPDGPLRTIPMAALHDGAQFLINKYAVATTPGLDLTDPRPLQRQDMKLLAAGLTQAVRGFPALPSVATELQALQRLYGGAPLLNEQFLAAAMEQESKTHPPSIMHIASHGYFAGEIENSFLVTFDDKLTMDRLSQVVGLFRFRETPLELLTLSACETAAGDDRAALGLAGVAIKAGARSVLATLWSVNDEASAVLVTAFYQQLHDTSVSRAVALQRAQRQLLADRRYQHPAYWSPFLLLNNWL